MSLGHLDHDAIGRLAAGATPTSGQAGHLAACPACRGRLCAADPGAIFGLLAALPSAIDVPPIPAFDVPRPATATPAWGARAALAAAAAALAVAVVALGRMLAPAPAPAIVAHVRATTDVATSDAVVRVTDPRARVVTLAAPSPGAPSVTMILGTEVDL